MIIFNGETISRLIMADTVGLAGRSPSRVFGAGKVIWQFVDV
jgi:hypothetical protein